MGSINKQSGKVRLQQLANQGGDAGAAGLKGNQASRGVKIDPSILRKMQRGTVLAANDSERNQESASNYHIDGINLMQGPYNPATSTVRAHYSQGSS